MSTTTKTASTEYSAKAAQAQDFLKRIATRLAEHQSSQAAEPRNWGYVGDLGRVNEELAQILAVLGDRSAVDEVGLKY